MTLANQLKEHYQVQPPVVLMKTPLIQQIKDLPIWTVSSNDKVPLDAKVLLEQQRLAGASLQDTKHWPLVSLNELDAMPDLDYVNRTIRLDARRNNIFMIDVEPSAPEELLRHFYHNCPANYAEISTNGGLHLMIKIPEDLITEENDYLLDTTVIKDNQNKVEYIFGNHYCTLTKKIITDKNIVDFDTDPIAKAGLKAILDSIVHFDAEAKVAREEAQRMKIQFNDDHINKKLISLLINTEGMNAFVSRTQAKTLNDYNTDDPSVYERKICAAVSFKIYESVQFMKTSAVAQQFATFSDNDAVYAVYQLAEKIIPYRDKHDEVRNGMPWLLYQAVGSFSHVKAQKNKKVDTKGKK